MVLSDLGAIQRGRAPIVTESRRVNARTDYGGERKPTWMRPRGIPSDAANQPRRYTSSTTHKPDQLACGVDTVRTGW